MRFALTIDGDYKVAVSATFPGPKISDLEFKAVVIKNLGHAYPNGTYHPMKGAEANWEWMRQYNFN